MIRTIVTAAVLIAAGQQAGAQNATTQPAPKLKELVTVASEIVRVGDLVDNAGPAANIAVFRAPDLGQTGSVQVSRVTDALRPHDVTAVDTGGLSEVVVTRLSRAISAKDIEERIIRALAGQYGFGDARNLMITMDREVRTMHVEASATPSSRWRASMSTRAAAASTSASSCRAARSRAACRCASPEP